MLRAFAPYLLAVALAGGALAWAYRTGFEAGRAGILHDLEEAQREVRAAVRHAENRRLELEAERDDLARRLEDAARADPVRVPDALSVDRVRRLNSLQ